MAHLATVRLHDVLFKVSERAREEQGGQYALLL